MFVIFDQIIFLPVYPYLPPKPVIAPGFDIFNFISKSHFKLGDCKQSLKKKMLAAGNKPTNSCSQENYAVHEVCSFALLDMEI